MNKKNSIVLLIAIIVILITAVSSFVILNHHNEVKPVVVNNTTDITNITEDVKTTTTNSGAHGYCAICGAPLSASEANDEYTQGKVCGNCARNLYYHTEEGSKYANQKLEEAYPEKYNGVSEESDVEY